MRISRIYPILNANILEIGHKGTIKIIFYIIPDSKT